MAVKRCPACNLVNPGTAVKCDCGRSFIDGSLGAPLDLSKAQFARTSGMAIAGFVLAFFCSLLGLIFSCVGYSECKKSNGTVKGEGLALAGIIISIVSMVLGILIVTTRSTRF